MVVSVVGCGRSSFTFSALFFSVVSLSSFVFLVVPETVSDVVSIGLSIPTTYGVGVRQKFNKKQQNTGSGNLRRLLVVSKEFQKYNTQTNKIINTLELNTKLSVVVGFQ